MKKTPVRRTRGPTGKKFMLIPPAVWLGGRSFFQRMNWSERRSKLDLCEGRNTSGWSRPNWAISLIERVS